MLQASAWSHFIQEGKTRGSVEVCLDQLLYLGSALSKQERDRILLYIEQRAKLDSFYMSLWHFVLGLVNSQEARWEEAIVSFQAVETNQLSYDQASLCLVRYIETCLNARLPINASSWQELERITTRYESDLNLKFQAVAVQCLQAFMNGNADQAASLVVKLRTMQELTRNPDHALPSAIKVKLEMSGNSSHRIPIKISRAGTYVALGK